MTSMNRFVRLVRERCGIEISNEAFRKYINILITTLDDEDLEYLIITSRSLRQKAIRELERRRLSKSVRA